MARSYRRKPGRLGRAVTACLHPSFSFQFFRHDTHDTYFLEHDDVHDEHARRIYANMRPLTLHASALTDPEYTLYTTALLDLAGEDFEETAARPHDDSYYASLTVSAREVRAWIRGRYTTLPPSQVDTVLKLFCPTLAAGDTLNGGQFFAALRLITHLRHGKPVDSSLVFVQGECRIACLSPLRLRAFPCLPFCTIFQSCAKMTCTTVHGTQMLRMTRCVAGALR